MKAAISVSCSAYLCLPRAVINWQPTEDLYTLLPADCCTKSTGGPYNLKRIKEVQKKQWSSICQRRTVFFLSGFGCTASYILSKTFSGFGLTTILYCNSSFITALVPIESFIQVFTVTATPVLVEITFTAAHGIVWLWRLQLLPFHSYLLKIPLMLRAAIPKENIFNKRKTNGKCMSAK